MQRLAGLLPGLFQAPGEFQLIEHALPAMESEAKAGSPQ